MEENTPLQRVVDIFIDYYGEDKVDLRGNNILIYFPHVTVTNEYDRSVDITELYVKVNVEGSGKLIGTFTLNRAEYTVAQYISGYMHSHVRNIPKGNFAMFQSCCLGTGPIKDTCLSLNREFDEDIWRLFAFELDKYVHTESVAGVPYIKLETIGIPRGGIRDIQVDIPEFHVENNPVTLSSMDTLLQRFLPYLIEKKPLSFNFNGKYSIADSPYNTVIKVSNTFIEWFNTVLTPEERILIGAGFREEGIILVCKVANGVIIKRTRVRPSFDANSIRSKIGAALWVFKGTRLSLNITDFPEGSDLSMPEDENTSTLLNPDVVMYIIHRMLRVINHRYGKTESTESSETALYL